MKQRIFVCLVSVCVLVNLFSLFAVANGSDTAGSGLGDAGAAYETNDLSFQYDLPTGTLSVSGSGELRIASETDPILSLYKYRDFVRHVVIGEGITGIGSGFFADFEALESVSFPYSLTAIGDFAFSGCGSLAQINLPWQLEQIGNGAFAEVPLDSVAIPPTVKYIGEGAFARKVVSDGQISFTVFCRDAYLYDKDDGGTFPANAVFYCYKDSTAEAWAKKFGRTFHFLSDTAEPETIEAGSHELSVGTAYRFGDGEYRIEGDPTVYAGNQLFYVTESGTYTVLGGVVETAERDQPISLPVVSAEENGGNG